MNVKYEDPDVKTTIDDTFDHVDESRQRRQKMCTENSSLWSLHETILWVSCRKIIAQLGFPITQIYHDMTTIQQATRRCLCLTTGQHKSACQLLHFHAATNLPDAAQTESILWRGAAWHTRAPAADWPDYAKLLVVPLQEAPLGLPRVRNVTAGLELDVRSPRRTKILLLLLRWRGTATLSGAKRYTERGKELSSGIPLQASFSLLQIAAHTPLRFCILLVTRRLDNNGVVALQPRILKHRSICLSQLGVAEALLVDAAPGKTSVRNEFCVENLPFLCCVESFLRNDSHPYPCVATTKGSAAF